jgi:site-specific recombinase XerC
VLGDLESWAVAQGYSEGTVPQIVAVGSWMSAWMDDHGTTPGMVDGALLDRFAAGFGPGVPGTATVRGRMAAVRRFFLDPGSVSPRAIHPGFGAAAERELDEWGAWLKQQRGVSEAAIRNWRRWAGGLVASLVDGGSVRWDGVGLAAVNGYIADRGKGYAPASRSLLGTAVRSLLRWALATGRTSRGLTRGILRPPATRATLPRGVAPGQVDALLAAGDPTTRVGARDRAVIAVLSRLGLRAGEAAALTLDDIDWGAVRLTVVGKQRRLTVPIPVDVGEALVAWLRMRPKDTSDRAVFTRLRAPIRRLTSAGISDVVVHRAERAGLGPIRAHRLRHTAAMNVIAAGGSLVEARELLGHASAETTKVYARTDLASLRPLAVPFGRVPR